MLRPPKTNSDITGNLFNNFPKALHLKPRYFKTSRRNAYAPFTRRSKYEKPIKSDQLNETAIHISSLHLQKDFVLLRYLLFPPIGINQPNSYTISHLTDSKTMKHKPNPKPKLQSFIADDQHPNTDGLSNLCFNPQGTVGPPEEETATPTSNETQSTSNTQDTSRKLMQKLTSRSSELEKLFSGDITTYTIIASGIHFPYFFFYDKVRQLEPHGSDSILWKIPSVKSIFVSAKLPWPSSGHLPHCETGHEFWWPFLENLPSRKEFFLSNSTLTVLHPQLGSQHQSFSLSSAVTTTTHFFDLFRNSSILIFVTNWTHWTPGSGQSDLIKTQLANDPPF